MIIRQTERMAIELHGRGDDASRGGITVVGTGSAVAAVDQATVTLGIEVERSDAGDAFRAAAASAGAVLQTLSDQGVESRSVRTADVTLGPRFDYADGTKVLAAYQATQRVVVSLANVTGLDVILTAIAGVAEGVRIDGVALSAANPRDVGSDARTAAMIDAREKAMSLAALAGRPLGSVLAVTELDGDPGSPRPIALMTHVAKDWSMPVALGDATVTVSVRVRFAWAD